uniref:Olfactory receptor n=1 Tax=Pelusios castaneus TaxID=367368 RepID=A0A8C8RIP3_9SAUR
MAAPNRTSSIFILLGIPGLEGAHGWISIPFCSAYILILLGNCLLLAVIKMEPSLHEPMYIFLSMLSLNHLVVSSIAVPRILCIIWFKYWDTRTETCLAQMYFFYSLSAMESGFIVAMGFDRYVAICNPLRHSAILNSRTIARVGLGVVLRGFILLVPYPFMVKQLPYCLTTISETYCDFVARLKIACDDSPLMKVYGPTMAFLTGGLDVFLITLSYILILQAVFKLPSKEARLMTLSTCGSHFCLLVISYSSGLFSYLSHFLGSSVPPHIHITLGNVYLLVPPILNPIIYGVRTKKIRESVFRIFSGK